MARRGRLTRPALQLAARLLRQPVCNSSCGFAGLRVVGVSMVAASCWALLERLELSQPKRRIRSRPSCERLLSVLCTSAGAWIECRSAAMAVSLRPWLRSAERPPE